VVGSVVKQDAEKIERLRELTRTLMVPDEVKERTPVILFVDDEEGIRRVFSRALAKLGPVLVAASADEALDLLKSRRVAILITDLCMPVHDGFWLACRAHELDADLPIIAHTAHHRDAVVRGGIFDRVMYKTQSWREVIDVAAKLMWPRVMAVA